MGLGVLSPAAGARVAGEAAADVAREAQTGACAAERKQLRAFKRTMAKKRRAFFRKTRSVKRRRAFVKKQKAQRKRLERRLARCLSPPAPAPAPPAPAPPGATATPAPTPGATPGPDRPAVDAIETVVSDAAFVAPSEVSPSGGIEVVRTQLELDLAPGATAAAFEALLARIQGQVVSSLEGVDQPTVRIPDPGSVAALNTLAASLRSDPALEDVDLVTMPVPDELPGTLVAGTAAVDAVKPQLATRAGAAWNARRALSDPPTLVLADFFGDGPPDGDILAVDARPADFSTPASPYNAANRGHSHGYLVAGMAAARFDPVAGAPASADAAAGTWAGPDLPLRAVDIRRGIGSSTLEDRILLEIASAPGDVVLNTSLAAGCAQQAGGCTEEEAVDGAIDWIDRVRGLGLEDQFLHVTSAGNMQTAAPLSTAAERNSEYSGAALLALPGGVESLSNVVVVENAIAAPLSPGAPTQVLCRNASSKRGGHVSAVGTDVTSLDSSDTGAFDPDGGTSAAAPQVAGIAASMWALDPGLTPQQIAARLRATARTGAPGNGDARCNAAPQPAPVLDAYGALLSTGSSALAAVLDADRTGQAAGTTRFDEADLEAFTEAFDTAAGAVDYGRFDLNGDGRTGGATTDRVDLDPSGTPQWSEIQRTVAGLPLTFDENALTDLAVLCHAAHGSLFQGDTSARDQFARERCVPPIALQAVHPSQIQTGQTLTLNVRATRADRGTAQSGVPIELEVTGGTAIPASGTTDQNGDFTAQTQISGGASQLKIVVRAKLGDAVLDEETVIATRPPSATVQKTFNLASATAFAMANGSGQGDSEKSPPGATSFSGTAAMTDAEEGDSASGNGALSFAESYSGDQLLGARVEISGSGSASGASVLGEGGGGYTLRFTVGAGGIAYSVTGSLSASGTDTASCQSARAHSYLIRSSQPGPGFVYDLCAPRDGSALSSSGTLPAGSYEFYVDAIAATSGGGASASADVTLSLGP